MNQNSIENYLDYWRNKRERQQEKSRLLAEKARNNLEAITELLVHEFKATKIILFGSLLAGKFHEESDIDLAVAGISAGDYFRALARVNEISERVIDLKPLEDLDPYFLEKVLRTGECIYARNNS